MKTFFRFTCIGKQTVVISMAVLSLVASCFWLRRSPGRFRRPEARLLWV